MQHDDIIELQRKKESYINFLLEESMNMKET